MIDISSIFDFCIHNNLFIAVNIVAVAYGLGMLIYKMIYN